MATSQRSYARIHTDRDITYVPRNSLPSITALMFLQVAMVIVSVVRVHVERTRRNRGWVAFPLQPAPRLCTDTEPRGQNNGPKSRESSSSGLYRGPSSLLHDGRSRSWRRWFSYTAKLGSGEDNCGKAVRSRHEGTS